MTSICRIGVVRDEVDIIDQNIRWYLDQGFPTILLDNGSTDGTYEICQSYRGQGIVRLERVPFDEHDREYSLRELAKLTADSGFKWLLLADADEFYESPVKEERLNQSLEREIQMGYNIVKFHNMEFWMTERDNPEEPDIMKRIRHYSYFDSNRYKLFPNLPGIDFWTKFGHVPRKI
ncbi:glycosyltransferase family 2 protein [Candidatus Woesearchaeota archaeon]|nr:glycosyltransferase family 2 protein [Candidatus Woesearchaeota archaeon]